MSYAKAATLLLPRGLDQFLNLSTIPIWGWIIFCLGAILCIVEC